MNLQNNDISASLEVDKQNLSDLTQGPVSNKNTIQLKSN